MPSVSFQQILIGVFQPNWKILVKLDHFPNVRGEIPKIFQTTTKLFFNYR